MKNTINKNNTSFMAMLKSLGTFGVVKEKMFSVSQLWKGVKLHLKALIVLTNGKLSSVPSRAKILHNLIIHIEKMNKHHGALITVKWLKANHVALQKYLGDDKLESLRGLEPNIPLPRLYNGLPSIINRKDRNRIKQGNTEIIQFWLTSFSLYRVLKSDFNPKLNSITDEYSGDKAYSWAFLDFIDSAPRGNFFSRLENYSSWKSKVNLRSNNVALIQSSSPSNSVSWHGLINDAVKIRESGVWKYFMDYITLTKSENLFRIFKQALSMSTQIPSDQIKTKKSLVDSLGQLAFKEEAAGKLRIFALVDIWTQSVLKPLHLGLFDLLKSIPNDGTFNQDASVQRSKEKAEKSQCAYSFDLSSATDRLPIIYQSAILDRILPIKVGNSWAGLLVMRDYFLPRGAKKYNITEKSVRYTVGQPMGALSSWAMLAITHHYLLQFCSFKKNKTFGWYENYEILGDDLVIFDSDVAAEYLELMRKLGLEINLSKSISSTSKPVFEFAKRTVVFGSNVSGLSVKQLISATSIGSRVANILYFANLGLIRTNTILSLLLSRFYKTDQRSAMLPSLALLGSLFNSKKISLKALVTSLIDPNNEYFDLNESKFSLPLKSILTAQKEILNNRVQKLDLLPLSKVETRIEMWDEMESDLTASVILKALQRAKELENSYDELTSSGSLAGCLLNDIRKQRETDPLIIYQLDGWLTELIIDHSNFDITDLVDEVETIAHAHAKYPSCTLEKALSILDRVDSWWMKLDIVKQKKLSIVNTLSPVYSWISSSQGDSRTGYLVERKFITDYYSDL
nr:MAG: putative RNA dependent RNA polymerase [Yunnan mito-like virus 45]